MTIRAILLLLVTIAFVISPFLNPEFGGFDPDRYPIPQINPPVQPAGYAFSIWGVIYLWLLIHAGLGATRYQRDIQWDATRPPLLVSLAVGAIWLPVALVSPIWATAMIWVMLVSAFIALNQARHGRPGWAVSLPLGLYAGWLTAASFVAIGLLGAGHGLLLDEVGWAVAALAAAFLVSLIAQHRLPGVWTYGLAASWGFAGIAVANFGKTDWLAGVAALAALITLAIAARAAFR